MLGREPATGSSRRWSDRVSMTVGSRLVGRGQLGGTRRGIGDTGTASQVSLARRGFEGPSRAERGGRLAGSSQGA